MRGVVFSDLVATIGAHRGTLHDVIEAGLFVAACDRSHALGLLVFLSARIFDK
jgi:hypothetical protein